MFSSVLASPNSSLLISWRSLNPFPRDLKEDYHSIKDDTPLVSVYTTRNVIVREMLIADDLLNDAIRDTQAYKDYKKEFVRVNVPTIQPQPVESTQGTNGIPRATRTPNPTDVKPFTTSPPPPSDDRERDEIYEATQLSLVLKEDVERIVEGEDEESDVIKFFDSVFVVEEDSGDRLEPESQKENPEKIDDDDDDVDEKKDDKKDDDDDYHDSCINQNSKVG
ncbi:hypothetical protein Tco_1440246 [Tanacetum coccineum]